MQLCDRLPSSPGETRMFPIIFSLSSFVVALYVVSRVLRKHYLLASWEGSLAVAGKLVVTRWNCVFVLRSRFSETVSTLFVEHRVKFVPSNVYILCFNREWSQEKKDFQIFNGTRRGIMKLQVSRIHFFFQFINDSNEVNYMDIL